MDAQRVIDLANAAGLALYPRGDALEIVGPVSARDALRGLVAEHQHTIVERLKRAPRRVMRSEPPTGELPEVRHARAELGRLIEALADAERWLPETRERVLFATTRQPASTLRADLSHFAGRLRGARAAE